MKENLTPAQDIIILLGTVFTIIACIYFVRPKTDSEFESWFNDLMVEAPKYNFTQEEIEIMEESHWEIYYRDGLSPIQALEQNKKETEIV